MLRPGGWMLLSGGDGPDIERDTATCNHCNTVMVIEPGSFPDLCLVCNKHVCDTCCATMNRSLKCVPFERRLDVMESRDRLFRAAMAG